MRATESDLRAVIRRNPRDGAALYYLALARQKAADTLESERLLEASLKADPTRALTWLALATLTESKGDAAHAEQILKEMRERFPDNAAAAVRLANLLLAREAPTAAHTLAKRATILTPQDAEAWITLGRTCLSLDRLSEARTALEQAARLQPNAWQVAFTQGDLLMTQRSFSEAATHYRRATTLAPSEPVPWLALAQSLVRGADPTASELLEAETCLQKAAALEKTVPLYPHIVAKLRMRQKRWKEALEPLAAARTPQSRRPGNRLRSGHRTTGAGQNRRRGSRKDIAPDAGHGTAKAAGGTERAGAKPGAVKNARAAPRTRPPLSDTRPPLGRTPNPRRIGRG
jgi:cytochrome c-type biogenesis protein CcmH/NrfG